MNFYSVTCTKYYCCEETDYINNQIIIIADCLYSAKLKLEKCLEKLNAVDNDIKYIPNEELHICDGIMIADGFEESTYHYGI